ncbi:hypothetical protein WJX73_007934 [Symbiochloris irregularis]|uniref:Uncharacterized protein n=1 Tax=Symbiochloris irregularis TaxID=706552 RepID=A0AAW1NM48_9CHLO
MDLKTLKQLPVPQVEVKVPGFDRFGHYYAGTFVTLDKPYSAVIIQVSSATTVLSLQHYSVQGFLDRLESVLLSKRLLGGGNRFEVWGVARGQCLYTIIFPNMSVTFNKSVYHGRYFMSDQVLEARAADRPIRGDSCVFYWMADSWKLLCNLGRCTNWVPSADECQFAVAQKDAQSGQHIIQVISWS